MKIVCSKIFGLCSFHGSSLSIFFSLFWSTFFFLHAFSMHFTVSTLITKETGIENKEFDLSPVSLRYNEPLVSGFHPLFSFPRLISFLCSQAWSLGLFPSTPFTVDLELFYSKVSPPTGDLQMAPRTRDFLFAHFWFTFYLRV